MMQEPLPNSSTKKSIAGGGLVEGLSDAPLEPVGEKQQASTLIEFPGASRALPEWRKQLSQRVREVQERKAREAAEELAAAQEAGLVSCALPSGQLELVPDLEQPVMNPIVSKALERIERARRTDHTATGFAATAAAPALAPPDDVVAGPDESAAKPVETKPKLTVVAPSKPKVEQSKLALEEPQPKTKPARKPVRVISDHAEDVALSYLETCLCLPAFASDAHNDGAGFARRTIAGSIDLLLVALMVAPVAAAIEFTDGDWSDPRVFGLMTGITIMTIFSYLTISIALTGRTLAMRMLSLRTIDTRTGLIPTGGQSIKRAVGYILSLAPFGLGLLYAFIDRDGRTLYDRFSKTLVVQD
jgi:uncharacterized RDD family membrane protein YckC